MKYYAVVSILFLSGCSTNKNEIKIQCLPEVKQKSAISVIIKSNCLIWYDIKGNLHEDCNKTCGVKSQ